MQTARDRRAPVWTLLKVYWDCTWLRSEFLRVPVKSSPVLGNGWVEQFVAACRLQNIQMIGIEQKDTHWVGCREGD